MKELAILLRCMHLYTHNCHNLVSGETFFQDHEFLGGLYGTYEGLYDSIIERILGTSKLSSQELVQIQSKATELLNHLQSDDKEQMFNNILLCEKELQKSCDKIKASPGTKNLLDQISDDSEVRCYKLQQRLKK